MGVGQDIFDTAKYRAKAIIKKFAKKLAMMLLTNPYTYIVLGVILLIIIIAGAVAGSDSSGTTNSGGMSSVVPGTNGSSSTESINVYNDDGTVNEEKIQELQLALENAHGLVTGSLSGNNIGGEYNKESCEKVTGTYLGFRYWDGKGIPRGNLGGIIYQCPWWANGRASQSNGKVINIPGHAKDMYENAQPTYKVGSTPKQNSLVVYNGGNYGHVAYVEAVDEVNKCYYISHAGSGKSWFGIQKIAFGSAPWSSYTLQGFIYLD